MRLAYYSSETAAHYLGYPGANNGYVGHADFSFRKAVSKEMTKAGADWQLHAYGATMHAFTNPAAANPGTPPAVAAAGPPIESFLGPRPRRRRESSRHRECECLESPVGR